MQKILVLLVFLVAVSCSSKKYDYRGNAKSYGAAPYSNTSVENPYKYPSSNSQDPYAKFNYPSSSLSVPPIPQAPKVPTTNVQRPSAAYVAPVAPVQAPRARTQSQNYYPYRTRERAPEYDNYLEDYYGRRMQDSRSVAVPVQEQPKVNKPPRDFDPITGGYEKIKDRITMTDEEKDKFGLLSNDSFAPGVEVNEYYTKERRGVRQDSRERVQNLDNNILDSLISNDPLSTGLYHRNIPEYQ